MNEGQTFLLASILVAAIGQLVVSVAAAITAAAGAWSLRTEAKRRELLLKLAADKATQAETASRDALKALAAIPCQLANGGGRGNPPRV